MGKYYVVGVIYEDLALSTQADVRRALTQFLRERERGENEWTGRAAHTLLLLAKEIGEDELTQPVPRMAEDDRFFPEDEEFHARLALLSIKSNEVSATASSDGEACQ